MREETDHNNSKHGHFLRSVEYALILTSLLEISIYPIDFDLCFGEKRMNFVLSSPECMLSPLSTNQSTKVEKSRFRYSSTVFISLCWKIRQVSLAYNRNLLSTTCGTTLIQIKKSSELKIELCGTCY